MAQTFTDMSPGRQYWCYCLVTLSGSKISATYWKVYEILIQIGASMGVWYSIDVQWLDILLWGMPTLSSLAALEVVQMTQNNSPRNGHQNGISHCLIKDLSVMLLYVRTRSGYGENSCT